MATIHTPDGGGTVSSTIAGMDFEQFITDYPKYFDYIREMDEYLKEWTSGLEEYLTQAIPKGEAHDAFQQFVNVVKEQITKDYFDIVNAQLSNMKFVADNLSEIYNKGVIE